MDKSITYPTCRPVETAVYEVKEWYIRLNSHDGKADARCGTCIAELLRDDRCILYKILIGWTESVLYG